MLFEPTKRAAVRVLHQSREGETLLLQMYLFGEEHAESSQLAELAARGAPQWLKARVEKHRADERRHAAMLREHLLELGVARRELTLDRFSAHKLERIRALIDGYAPRFEHGHLVTLLAAALVLEDMAARVFARHASLLNPSHPLHATLERVLLDEKKHVRLCEDSLSKLVAPHEKPALEKLLAGIRRAEQSFRTPGAALLLFAGVGLWLKERLASSTSRSRTHAAT
jgi:hypothetical protein